MSLFAPFTAAGEPEEDDYSPTQCRCPDCGQTYSGADGSGGHHRGGKYGGCCQSFRSNTTAEAHFIQVGDGKARCATPDEMRARGWNRDEYGVWRAAPPAVNPWKKER